MGGIALTITALGVIALALTIGGRYGGDPPPNVGSLAAFALVCITVIYLRTTHKDMPRPFRTPLYPVVPILGAVMCVILLMSLMAGEHTRNFFIIYLIIGIAVYFFYGIRKSKLGRGVVVEGSEGEPHELPHRVGEEPKGQG